MAAERSRNEQGISTQTDLVPALGGSYCPVRVPLTPHDKLGEQRYRGEDEAAPLTGRGGGSEEKQRREALGEW